jgi:hypothetical protein
LLACAARQFLASTRLHWAHRYRQRREKGWSERPVRLH